MALDPDTKALLEALLTGQVKQDAAITRLAEEQASFRREVADGQARQDAAITRLAGIASALVDAHSKLTVEVEHMTSEVRHLGERLDSFGEQVVRGFTEAVERDRELGARIDALERDR